jgi:uncharacterized protein YjiS (DUF1127 family)
MIENFTIPAGATLTSLSAEGARRASLLRRLGNGLSSAAAQPWQSLQASRRLRLARRQLRALDDRLLADVGISRHDIDTVVDALAARRGLAGTWH